MLVLLENKNWEYICASERSLTYKSIFHNYDLYVTQIDDIAELSEIIGHSYFIFDICTDEIVEMFNEMTSRDHTNGLVHHMAFITFLFKKALYTKQISREVAVNIYKQFIGYPNAIYTHDGIFANDYNIKYTDFINKLITYGKSDDVEADDYVYGTLLGFLAACNYEW